MGILEWLFRTPSFKRFEDSFAMDRANLWPQLRVAILKQQQDGFTPWIVCHFADTFLQVQELLDQWNIPYEIASERIEPQSVIEFSRSLNDSLLLVLADLLQPTESADLQLSTDLQLALMIVERHPYLLHDQSIGEFAKKVPCQVRYGYLLSIEDAVVRRVVNDLTIQILKQLGMKQHELITSNMITRRLEQALARDAASFQTDLRADSADEWYRLNDIAQAEDNRD